MPETPAARTTRSPRRKTPARPDPPAPIVDYAGGGRPGPRPAADREQVLAVARRRVLELQPFDVRAIAAELGLGRTTMYRWFGDKEALLGEVLWTLARDTLTNAYDGARGRGAKRLRGTVETFIRAVTSFEPLLHLLQTDPQGTVSVLMTRDGGVQDRLIASLEQLIDHERRTGAYQPVLDTHSLAYLVVQVGMSYMFGTALVDLPPDVEQAVAVANNVLGLEAAT